MCILVPTYGAIKMPEIRAELLDGIVILEGDDFIVGSSLDNVVEQDDIFLYVGMQEDFTNSTDRNNPDVFHPLYIVGRNGTSRTPKSQEDYNAVAANKTHGLRFLNDLIDYLHKGKKLSVNGAIQKAEESFRIFTHAVISRIIPDALAGVYCNPSSPECTLFYQGLADMKRLGIDTHRIEQTYEQGSGYDLNHVLLSKYLSEKH